jgi:hypothetical protein
VAPELKDQRRPMGSGMWCYAIPWEPIPMVSSAKLHQPETHLILLVLFAAIGRQLSPCLKWNLGWGLPAREAVLREMRRFGCKRTLQDSDAEHSWLSNRSQRHGATA